MPTTLEPVDAAAVPVGAPDPDPAVAPDLAFWEKVAAVVAGVPAPTSRSAAPAEPRGYRDRPERPVAGTASPKASFADALRQGIAAGESTLKRVLESGGSSPEVNGWKLTIHVGR